MPKEYSLKANDGEYLKTFDRGKRQRGFLKHRISNIKLYHICFFISVLLVSLLAGMRDYTVGTDIKSYGNPLFYAAKSYSSYFVFKDTLSHIEPLYLLLVYFCSSISDEPHILYFFTGFIIYLFMILGFLKMGKHVSVTLSWTCFLFLLYSDTYNAMRQSIAIAIGFWAFYFLIEKKFVPFFIGLILAFMFHTTSIIFLCAALIYLVLMKNNGVLVKVLIVLGMVGGIYFFNQILEILMAKGILQSKMERYLINGNTGISVLAILNRLPFLFLILVYKNRFWNYKNEKITHLLSENEGDFYIIMLLIEMFTVEMSAFVPSLYRIALFFVPFRCIAYSRFCSIFKGKERIMYSALLIIYILIIFVYQNQVKGNNDIYPYIFG